MPRAPRRQGTGQPGIQRAEAMRLARPLRQAQQHEQRQVQVPSDKHAASPAAAGRAGAGYAAKATFAPAAETTFGVGPGYPAVDRGRVPLGAGQPRQPRERRRRERQVSPDSHPVASPSAALRARAIGVAVVQAIALRGAAWAGTVRSPVTRPGRAITPTATWAIASGRPVIRAVAGVVRATVAGVLAGAGVIAAGTFSGLLPGPAGGLAKLGVADGLLVGVGLVGVGLVGVGLVRLSRAPRLRLVPTRLAAPPARR
jgi:hypothetical protein